MYWETINPKLQGDRIVILLERPWDVPVEHDSTLMAFAASRRSAIRAAISLRQLPPSSTPKPTRCPAVPATPSASVDSITCRYFCSRDWGEAGDKI